MSASPYFESAETTNTTCNRTEHDAFTDSYHITYIAKNITTGAPRDSYVTFSVDMEANRIVHFVDYGFWSIWEWSGKEPTAYSEANGILTPQAITGEKRNVTSAFKGPIPT